MQAIILAAGMGKRLKDLTANNTKCMVKVSGITLIERSLRQLDELGLKQIVIVVGYEGKKLIDFISTLGIHTPILYVDNPIYDKTNNIYSLALAKEYLLEDDTLLLESDLIFEEGILKKLMEDPRETLALVDKYESWMDGTVIKVGEEDEILEFVPGKKFVFEDIPQYYKTVNIYKFGKHFSQTHYVPFLDAYSKALGDNEYYEQVLRVITLLDDPEIKAKRLQGERWYEIDDVQDLDIAESLFAPSDEERLTRIQSRYGGYWRYPKLLDFCYLVNPYYPSNKMKKEMIANFDSLLTQYPSGMYVNSLLASRNFGVKQDYIAVGNGAAELIKSVMEAQTGKIGVVSPTFEEYPNRYKSEDIIRFVPSDSQLRYTEQELIDFYTIHKISTLVLVNPDNPTGNYISSSGINKLLEWAKESDITVILDESFIDFADEERVTYLNNDYLEHYPNLIVIKSISKSYGVPGLRLGVIASAGEGLIADIKKDVAIWNINSFGEFYMQIFEKYRKDYEKGLSRFYQTRRDFMEQLKGIPGLEVLPTQANYVMVRLQEGRYAAEITKELLLKHSILIKDLTSKMRKAGFDGEYLRIAVRNHRDNDSLCKALTEIMNEER